MERRLSCCVVIAVVWVAAAVAGAFAASGATKDESLGGQLMEGMPLGPALPSANLSGGGRDIPPVQPAAVPTERDDEGEDIGESSGPLPLVRARYGMRTAQAMLVTSRPAG